jgi:hypothetical protein
MLLGVFPAFLRCFGKVQTFPFCSLIVWPPRIGSFPRRCHRRRYSAFLICFGRFTIATQPTCGERSARKDTLLGHSLNANNDGLAIAHLQLTSLSARPERKKPAAWSQSKPHDMYAIFQRHRHTHPKEKTNVSITYQIQMARGKPGLLCFE